MRNKRRFLLVTITSIAMMSALLAGGFMAVKSVGKNHLQSKADTTPGRVKYQNTLYQYKESITTFLVMGIDKGKETFEPWEIDDGGNGQADALFLAVLDAEDKTIKVIGINRNTMTDIDFYDDDGNYLATFPAQVALQHAYGTTPRESCEFQLETIRDLFYNLPVHGYAAINISAVPVINDSVGGVDVEVLEDITEKNPDFIVGNQVRLMGESAYWYVKYRDIDLFASVDMRTKRQAQYLNGFIDAAKHSVKRNPFVALKLYQEISPEMVTDITASEAVYLASVLPQYRFEEDSFYKIEGETIMGEEYEEFYPDEAALFELILEVFYEPVEESE